MNPEAFYEINKKGRTQYILPESVGKLKYIAGYSPLPTGQVKLPAI